MKRLILTISFLLFVFSVYAGPLQQMHSKVIAAMDVAGGSLCTTTTIEISQEVNNATKNVNTASSYGQRFTTIGAIDVESIEFYLTLEYLESGEFDIATMRVGPDDDLTSTYIGLGTVTISEGDSASWIKVTFPTPISLAATSTFRFAIHWPLAATDGLVIGVAQPDVYADNNYLFNAGDGTSWVYGNSDSTDLMFRINKCTN